MSTLKDAIKSAGEDYLENDGVFTPHNPAICRDGDRYEYSSSLHEWEDIVWDLQEGFGNWTPEPGDNLDEWSEAVAGAFMEND